tara:strand:+ start:7934 stop:8407 length:474 start_codon:yes stop_codon:yes gene_type:complete
MQVEEKLKTAFTSPYNTGEVLYDLPSPYQAHPCGLLHLPRFIAKIRKHLAQELPKSYQRNFTRGFDGFLCLHLGVDPQEVIEIVRTSEGDNIINKRLKALFPENLKSNHWNRKMAQMGMSPMGKEKLEEVKFDMGLSHRTDLMCFADIIEVDEGRLF